MPEHSDQKPRQDRAHNEGDPFDLLRAAVGGLLDLSAEAVAPAESEIKQHYDSAHEEAEQDLAESSGQIEARDQEESEAIDQTHADRIKRIESEYQQTLRTFADNHKKSLERAAAELRAVERDARPRRDDRLLITETVAQATVKGLQKEFRAAEGQVAGARRRLELLHERMLGLLREYRHELPAETAPSSDEASTSENAGAAHRRHAQDAARRLQTLQTLSTPRLFVGARPYALVILCSVGAAAAAGALSVLNVVYVPAAYITAPVALLATLTAVLLVGRSLRRKARVQIDEALVPLRSALAAAHRALAVRLERAEIQFERDKAGALEQRERETQSARDEYDARVTEAEQHRAQSLQEIEQARAQQQGDIEQRRANALQKIDERQQQRRAELKERCDQESAAARHSYERRMTACRDTHDTARTALEDDWKQGLAHIQRLLEETDRLNREPRFDWSDGVRPDWTPPTEFATQIPFGRWNLDLARLAAGVRERAPFLEGRPGAAVIPAMLTLPTHASLFLQTERAGRPQAINALRSIMLRLLTSLPPGRVHFTIIDPVGLGENFAGFMHLVDYEDALVGGRIWTESEHIEARLTELTNHMEHVIQKYLRNEFETIDAYNEQAGQLAEPYRFLVIADFPANFNEGAARRLSSIVASGARCGVFTLVAHDTRLPNPPDLQLEDLSGGSIHLVYEDGRFVFQDDLLRRFPLTLETPPSEEILTRIMHVVGRGAKDSLRVEVPFASIAPPYEQCWTRSAREDLVVPLGHTGAVRLQHLRLGRGIAQHALIAGKTGSGKSTLLHVMITNLALWYGPDELEFYLVDFKKGVEFKAYVTHPLPHARAIAIESDREFGVSVLQRLDAELGRRGDLFRAAGVQDLAAYRGTTAKKLPRTLLIVDEFQVFFTEDDKLSQDAAILLDRLVRQGRAFGIHVLLGSQTLGGAAGLARSTMGQMAVRIALQCSEADSQLILDDTNVAARLLLRPGEAIYNDAGGLVEGNSPFQTAWLPDDQRSVYLDWMAALIRLRKLRREPAIVFEGNAPADIRQNRALTRLLEAPTWPGPDAAPQAWLGEAVAIKDPTSVTFRRQSGANVLFVGQRDDAALAMMATAMMCLAAQHAPQAARFIVLDGRATDAQQASGFTDLAALLPHQTQLVRWRDVPAVIAELAEEVRRRLAADQTDAPAIYLLVYGLQRYRMLRRQDDDFSFSAADEDKPPAPDKLFAELLREGPPFGLHVLAWSDTLATLERTLDRQTMSEFDNRVLFQMGASDSANLIDTPEANKLGFFRALFYSEERGLLEKFRPYAAFDADWLEKARGCFARKAPSAGADECVR